VCDVRRYLEMDISLPPDSVHKFADEMSTHLLCSVSEVRRLFLVEDMVDTLKVCPPTVISCHYSPRESEGVCFHRRWFVCLFVTTITKKIVDGFVPNFMGMFLRGKGRLRLCFVTIGRGMWK